MVFFQLVNLPVEFNASSRAKAQLVDLGIINSDELLYVNKVLNAAAWTYVAATLQSVMILLYYVSASRPVRVRATGCEQAARGGLDSAAAFYARGSAACLRQRRATAASPPALLATHCWMKYMPSTPSLTLG